MNFETLLKKMIEMKGSDVFITAGKEPCVKVRGKIEVLGEKVLTDDAANTIIMSLMNEKQQKEFLEKKELNFAIDVQSIGRFRVNVYMQKGNVAAVLRRIESKIPTIESLHLPPILEKIIMKKKGLILFVGGTGTGKSTSLASLIGYRNTNSKGHIVTVENPIEFIHNHQGCLISQREIGIDTESFELALKNSLRQAPDVILIGEVRTQETMSYAINFAETGHLCLATLHATNTSQALDRIVNFFPPEQHNQLWLDLSFNLVAIIGQKLIPTVDGKARVPAIEILVKTPVIRECIREGRIGEIKKYMKKGTGQGMQTFDQSLYEWYKKGKISYEDALKYADSENNLRLRIKFSKKLQDHLEADVQAGASQKATPGKGATGAAKKPEPKKPKFTLRKE